MNTSSRRIQISDIGFVMIILSYLLLVLSSPMPINIGMIEIIMGAGLTIGALLVIRSLIALKDKALILPALCIAYFLLVPLLVGLVRGNNLSDIARDVAPLMFMVLLPLLITFLPHDRNSPYRRQALLIAILAVGLVSALQFHHGIVQLVGSMDAYTSRYAPSLTETKFGVSKLLDFISQWFIMDSTSYMMMVVKGQDPAILFSAIYLLCLGLALTLLKPRRLLPGLLALGGGWLCAYEFSALGMRAYLGLTILGLVIYSLHLIRSRKLPLRNFIIAGMLGLLLTYTQLINLAAQMWAKHQVAGLNGKIAEVYAALGVNTENFTAFLLGTGWGGLFPNPIVNGELTRFTHSLISYWFLKTGIVGFAVMVYFVTLLIRRSNLKGVWTSSHRLAVVLAASAVIIIALFFEVTYKMLSFGMIVGLLLAELSLSAVPNHKYKVGQKNCLRLTDL